MSVRVMNQVFRLDLPSEIKFTLIAYADNADDRGVCWPSKRLIAHKVGGSERTVRRHVKRLRKRGLMEVMEEGGGRGNPTVYRIRPEKGDKLSGFMQKGDTDDRRNPDTDDRETPSCVTKEPSKNHQEEPSSENGDAGDQHSLFSDALEGASPRENGRSPVEKVWQHYLERYAERFEPWRAEMLDLDASGRRGHIKARLRDGYQPKHLMAAIEGNFTDQWHRDRGKHELEYILRNQSKVEEFLTKFQEEGPAETDADQAMKARLERLDRVFGSSGGEGQDALPSGESGEPDGREIEV